MTGIVLCKSSWLSPSKQVLGLRDTETRVGSLMLTLSSPRSTFLKRKGGLFKKAHELSVLCSVDVAVFIFGSNKKLYEYSSTNMPELINRYTFVRTPGKIRRFRERGLTRIPSTVGRTSTRDPPISMAVRTMTMRTMRMAPLPRLMPWMATYFHRTSRASRHSPTSDTTRHPPHHQSRTAYSHRTRDIRSPGATRPSPRWVLVRPRGTTSGGWALV